jgi:beta-glucosidase
MSNAVRSNHGFSVQVATVVFLLIAGLSARAIGQTPPAAAASPDVAKTPWLDTSLSVDQRAQALLDKMTLAEKIGQMRQVNGIGGEPTGDAKNLIEGTAIYDLVRKGQVGSVLNEISPAMSNALQWVAVEESRLGVPLIFGRDVIHGFRTIFPIPLGQAASWNPELVEQAAAVAAREARSQGVHWTFAPMVDIARDPRWGRIAESLGEDPHLASSLAAAMVRGFQGGDLASPDHVAACAKHFAGYGAAEGGRDYNTTVISPELMQNVYLRPFHAAVDAGVATLMCAFNEVNGVPASANVHLLRVVLRRQWGFRGFVVSDWESILETVKHGFAADEKAAALAAVRAGVNMEMTSHTYHDHLADLVDQGVVPESMIDQLVLDILRVKFQLGLFERPYTDMSQPSRLLAADHLELARRLARQSVVLLKNERQVLPLDMTKVKTLAVIGPLADAPWDQLGTWVPDGREADSRTLLAAVRERAGNSVDVRYALGLANDWDRSTAGLDAAVAAAREADVVLLAVGERANISGEARSRAILDLPSAQNQLVEAVAAEGKPVILIVQAGRPLTIGRQVAQVDAVLYSLHAGTMAGPAIVDLLWGDESPSGKLPVTFAKTVGQVPLYYNHKNTGRPPRPYDFDSDRTVDDRINTELGYNSNYIDVGPYPLYPFGYGLSYTTFKYGKVDLSAGKLRPGGTLAVRVPVTNAGKVAADEIVQLYVRDLVGSITRPVRELKGFRRVHLAPGQTLVVEFALAADDLAFYNNEEERVLEPGKFEVYVGGSSLAPPAGEFELAE